MEMNIKENEFLVVVKGLAIQKMLIPNGNKISFPEGINCVKDSVNFNEQTVEIFRDERLSIEEAAYMIAKSLSNSELSIKAPHNDDEPDDCMCDDCEMNETGFFAGD